MPLSCDCFDGCWGHHSKNWPSFEIPDALIEIARKRGDRYPGSFGYFLIADAKIPYGSYVIWENTIRVEDTQYVEALHEAAVRMRMWSSVEAWTDNQTAIIEAARKVHRDTHGPAKLIINVDTGEKTLIEPELLPAREWHSPRLIDRVDANIARGERAEEEENARAAKKAAKFNAKVADYITENLSVAVETTIGYYDEDRKTYRLSIKLGEREISYVEFDS